jgi:hypothetical protein
MSGWELRAFPSKYLYYDWHSGLWECTPEATIDLGFGEFGGWVADMLEPQ